MCGLVGVVGSLVAKDDDAIKKLLWFDYFRGPDSTGLASVNMVGDIKLAKVANSPHVLWQMKSFDTVLSGLNRVYLGHNRYATRGGKSDANAHPFVFGNIIGAHNGTLDNSSWTRLEEAIGEKFHVDSMALIKGIEVLGPEAAIELCTEGRDSHSGAWALTWFDTTDNSFHMLRNQHRPLWYGFSKDCKRMYYASEWWMMEYMGKVCDIEFHAEEGTGYRFFPVPQDEHLTWKSSDFFTATKPIEPDSKPLKGREPLLVATPGSGDPFGRTGGQHGSGCGFQVGTHTQGHSSKSSKTTSHGEKRTSTPDNVLHWFGNKAHPYAGYFKPEEFDNMTRYGCSWCQTAIDYGETGLTFYERQDTVLCPKCSGHEVVTVETPIRIHVSNDNFNILKESESA